MPRQVVTKVEKSFVRGLVTDVTALQFPENGCTDTDNCVFDFTGRVIRRNGLDVEEDYALFDTDLATGEAYTEFLWEAVAGREISFVVQQKGHLLYFFDSTSTTAISGNAHATVIDLTDFIPTDSGKDPGVDNCQYATGRGQLIVVNPAIDPIYIVYDPDADTLTATAFEIEVRDFVGIEDGLGLTERPEDTVAGLRTSNPEHYYNLLNQGWVENNGSALAAWDTARTDLPSRADYIGLYRSSPTVNFEAARVTNQDPLTSPAPTGHFILTATNPDRNQAMIDEGFTGATIGESNILIGGSIGTVISSGWNNSANAFDGTFGGTFASTISSNNYIGKNFSASPKQIVNATLYGLVVHGFQVSSDPSITFELYAKQTAPSSPADGTLLGTLTFTDTADETGGRTVTSNDTTTFWNYVWVKTNLGASGGGTGGICTELEFVSPGTGSSTAPNTTERPHCVTFFAGRLWFSGIEDLALNNTIFFTQILEREEQYGQCYQIKDPTSEYFFDLLASDGGTIVIPEMGRVMRLFNAKNALIIIATNGVWAVQGAQGQYFRANDYQIKNISTVGSVSPLSVVNSQGLPIWWGTEGIYSLKFDPSYDAFNLEFLSAGVLDLFLATIPNENKKYVKGIYSPEEYLIYWLYNSSELAEEPYTYNSMLIHDVRSQAYYRWTFNAPIETLDLRGVVFTQPADRSEIGTLRFPITWEPTNTTQQFTYAALTPTLADWTVYDDEIEDLGGAQEYTSYFITGYYHPGDAIRFAQGNYILTLCEQTDSEESAFVQGVFDFAIDGNAGKWGSRQQIYTDFMENRSLTWRRVKVRGKGRSIQLRYSSDSTKPFTIIGWSIPISINQGL